MTRTLDPKTFEAVPRSQQQSQASTEDQLFDLRAVANRLGLYDAADALTSLLTDFRRA